MSRSMDEGGAMKWTGGDTVERGRGVAEAHVSFMT